LFSYLLYLWICHYFFTPAIILLGILYLIYVHTSDGQHKHPNFDLMHCIYFSRFVFDEFITIGGRECAQSGVVELFC
jgi:hypothetical protein